MAFKGWEKVAIRTAQGEAVEAVAPVIVSASRRTDIPAFYAEWLVERLRAGYVRWVNPFSGTPQFVSFARTRAVVFWTKNPRPMLPHLAELDRRGIGYYFQFTLNDYETEGLEPGVPPLRERVETFRELSQAIGKEKVVWRYDPLLLAEGLTAEGAAESRAGRRAASSGHGEAGCGVCGHRAVREGAKSAAGLRQGLSGAPSDETRDFAELLAAATRSWGIAIATCAEAIDLTDLGIGRNKCIDDEPAGAPLRRRPGADALSRSRGVPTRPQGQGAAEGVRLHRQQGHRRVRHLPASLSLLLRQFLRADRPRVRVAPSPRTCDVALRAAPGVREAPVDRTHSIPYSACGAGKRGRLNGLGAFGTLRGPARNGGDGNGEAGGGIFATRVRGVRSREGVSFSTWRRVYRQGHPGGPGCTPGTREAGLPGHAGGPHRWRGGGRI